jgi:hypothetical protein
MNMFELDVGRDGHVWAVDRSQNIYWREGVTETKKEGTEWSTVNH